MGLLGDIGNFLGTDGKFGYQAPSKGIDYNNYNPYGGNSGGGAKANDLYNARYDARQSISQPQGNVLGDSTGPYDQTAAAAAAKAAQDKADSIAAYTDQEAQLRALLARTDTGLAQGLTRNEDLYNTNVGQASTAHDQQVTNQNLAKQSQYDQINRGANNGYRSLSQIIGRSAGTGSSAFQEALPDAIGKDTSSKRLQTTDTFGRNLSNIEGSYQTSLADLLKQKKANEESLRGGIEGQRQGIQGQIAQNAAQLAQARGGGYAQVKAAQAPALAAIENSRNQVEGFFNQFRTPYTQPNTQPNLAAYTTDRSTINAQQDQGVDPTNPYASLLRKKLQGAL